MEQIVKPISIMRQEFFENIVQEINACGLPAWVIEPILEDILKTLKVEVQKQYEFDKAQYEQALAQQSNEK